MAEAWSVVVHREPEWDEYGRSEAIADVLYERRLCKRCGAVDSFVPVPPEMPVRWSDGRVFVVRQHRCLGCGSLELVQRDTHEKHKDHKHVEGRYSPEDGLRMTVDERS